MDVDDGFVVLLKKLNDVCEVACELVVEFCVVVFARFDFVDNFVDNLVRNLNCDVVVLTAGGGWMEMDKGREVVEDMEEEAAMVVVLV